MIEPGLLRVFRGYALARVLLGVAVLVGQFAFPSDSRINLLHGARGTGPFFTADLIQRASLLVVLVVVLLMVLLGLFLFSGWLERRLGKAYIPMAIAIASATLFLEQYLLTPRAVVWQADSFFFILLILVAWQYNMRTVLLFSILVALTDYVLSIAFRLPLFFVSFAEPVQAVPLGRLEMALFLGRQTGRILSFLVVGFVITSLMQGQRRQRQELASANRALVQHAGTLEQLATSRERNRLSRELHDTVAHTLSGLTVQLEALQTAWGQMPAQASEMVEKMLSVTRNGLHETRRTLQNLRASPLEELGLALAIQALAEDASNRKSMRLELEIETKPLELPAEVGQAFYRVAQEALENVVRHAHADRVKLKLKRWNGRVELAIADDGAGFDLSRVKVGERYGLTLMKERAELIGARFEVQSKSGQGTTVRMEY